MRGTVQMRLDITEDAWEDLDVEKLKLHLAENVKVSDWVLKRNSLAGAVTHRIVGDTEGRAMYLRGKRESSKERNCDYEGCPCTLTYWDRKLGHESRYLDAFLDGWADGASGDEDYAPIYAEAG